MKNSNILIIWGILLFFIGIILPILTWIYYGFYVVFMYPFLLIPVIIEIIDLHKRIKKIENKRRNHDGKNTED